MTELLYRFNFDANKVTGQVIGYLIIIWLLVLGCAVLSIRNRPFTNRQRWFWILVIVCFPGVGLLCYLPFSLSKDRLDTMYRGKTKK